MNSSMYADTQKIETKVVKTEQDVLTRCNDILLSRLEKCDPSDIYFVLNAIMELHGIEKNNDKRHWKSV